MAEQSTYSPVSFGNIVPQLDVGDPSQSFLNSMKNFMSSQDAQMSMLQKNESTELRNIANYGDVEQQNIKSYYKGLEDIIGMSQNALKMGGQLYVKQREEKAANIWAENFNKPVELDDAKLYAEYEADEINVAETQQAVGVGIAKSLNNRPVPPSAEDIADTGKIRNSMSMEAVVAANARAAAAMESYSPALETWLNKTNPTPGAETKAYIAEFNRRWSQQTGLAGANEQFTAKYVYPTLRKAAAGVEEAKTRGWNAQNSAEQSDILVQDLALGTIGLDSFFIQQRGLTKSNGKDLRTNDDAWATLTRANLSTDQLTSLGQQPFGVTGKPYSEHPRYQTLMRDARKRAKGDYDMRNAEYKMQSQEGFRALGPESSKAEMEAERDRQLALGIPSDIVDANLGTQRRSSAEAATNREWGDKIEAWVNNPANAGKKIPLSVIGDAPFAVKQQYAGSMEPDANAETTEELIRSSAAFKAAKKDIKAIAKQINPGIAIASDAMGTTGAINQAEFENFALTQITNRAQQLMLGQESMSLEQAFAAAKADWIADTEKLNKDGKFFDVKNNKYIIPGGRNLELEQNAADRARDLFNTPLTKLSTGLLESDWVAPPTNGRYSERVRVLGSRYGMTGKQIVDLARQQQGLPPLTPSRGDKALEMVSGPEMARIASLDSSPVMLGLRAQINSGQVLQGNAKQRTIAVGQQLNAMGYGGIWQHPDFNYDSGYTGSGREELGGHSANSYHKYNEALDIGVQANGHQKLEMLYQYLLKNKSRFGVAELFYDPDGSRGHPAGHGSHIHVSFGGGDVGKL